MADDEIKLIRIELVVGEDTITATYVRPEKIAGMLAEEKSLGGFLREMLFIEADDVEDPPPTTPPRTMTQRELDLLNGFEALMEKAELTPDEVRSMVCAIVAGFAVGTGVSLEKLHDEIDAAYEYKISREERPS